MKKSIRVLKVFCALFLLMLLCSTWFVLYCTITGYESCTLRLGYFLGFAIYTLWGDTSIIVVGVINFITTLFLLKMIIPMFSLPKLHHSHWGSHIYITLEFLMYLELYRYVHRFPIEETAMDTFYTLVVPSSIAIGFAWILLTIINVCCTFVKFKNYR